MNNTIRVTGEAEIMTAPDQYRIHFSIGVKSADSEQAVSILNLKYGSLHDQLLKVGFKKKDLKSNRYTLNTCRETEYNDRLGKQVETFKGYKAEWSGSVQWDMDGLKLADVFHAIEDSHSDCTYELSYRIKDTAKVSDQLLKECIKDSRKKAQILAEAVNCSLGEIQQIDYSYSRLTINDECDGFADSAVMCCSAPTMIPEEIKNTDSVTVLWQLKNHRK
jgi:uncharacterized protein YggE